MMILLAMASMVNNWGKLILKSLIFLVWAVLAAEIDLEPGGVLRPHTWFKVNLGRWDRPKPTKSTIFRTVGQPLFQRNMGFKLTLKSWILGRILPQFLRGNHSNPPSRSPIPPHPRGFGGWGGFPQELRQSPAQDPRF